MDPSAPLLPRWALPVCALLSLALLMALATSALGPRGTVVLDDYASMLAPLLSGAACARRSLRTAGRMRTAWALLALSLLSAAAGGLVWTVEEVHRALAVPFPGFADIGYLLAVPLAAAGLLVLPGGRSGRARLQPLLDGVIAAGALLFVSWSTVLGPVLREGAGSVPATVVTLAYPAGDVLTATIALLALARARGPQRAALVLLSAGLLLVAGSDSVYAWLSASGSYATGSLCDAGAVAGYLLLGVAALGRPGEPAEDPGPDSAGRFAPLLPYVPLLLSLPFAAALQLRGTTVGPFLFYDAVVVLTAVLGRQLMSVQANAALSRELHDTVAVLRRREQELHHQAFHDPLTGLANRALFADRVEHALRRRHQPRPVFLLLADLDDFKRVNDTMGHAEGDALLVLVAERLRTAVRPQDTVARLGGDEFAVLLETTDLEQARAVAARVNAALAQEFRLADGPVSVSASIGIAEDVPGDLSGVAMRRHADLAMYAAKARGKGCFAAYPVVPAQPVALHRTPV